MANLHLMYPKHSTLEYAVRGFRKDETDIDLDELIEAFENCDNEAIYEMIDEVGPDFYHHACPVWDDPIEISWEMKDEEEENVLSEGTFKIDASSEFGELGNSPYDLWEMFDDNHYDNDCYILVSVNVVKWACPVFENMPADRDMSHMSRRLGTTDFDNANIKYDQLFESLFGKTNVAVKFFGINDDEEEFESEDCFEESGLGDMHALLKYTETEACWEIIYFLDDDGTLKKKVEGKIIEKKCDEDDEDDEDDDSEESPFADKSFLFTGKLSSMKREDAEAYVEELGGTIANSVTKTLDVLVATSNTSSKWKKAEQLDANGTAQIELWTEEEFVQKLKEFGDYCDEDEDDED